MNTKVILLLGLGLLMWVLVAIIISVEVDGGVLVGKVMGLFGLTQNAMQQLQEALKQEVIEYVSLHFDEY